MMRPRSPTGGQGDARQALIGQILKTAVGLASAGRFDEALRVLNGHGKAAHIKVGPHQELIFRETDQPLPEFDGHHLQVYVEDFGTPHKKLKKLNLITEESDQHQYRFVDIVDVDTNRSLFQIEHETRSMRHPMFNRNFINRNPDMNNRNFVPGYEVGVWALA